MKWQHRINIHCFYFPGFSYISFAFHISAPIITREVKLNSSKDILEQSISAKLESKYVINATMAKWSVQRHCLHYFGTHCCLHIAQEVIVILLLYTMLHLSVIYSESSLQVLILCGLISYLVQRTNWAFSPKTKGHNFNPGIIVCPCCLKSTDVHLYCPHPRNQSWMIQLAPPYS